MKDPERHFITKAIKRLRIWFSKKKRLMLQAQDLQRQLAEAWQDKAKLKAENEALKRDFAGVHQISQDVVSLAEEIRKTCPQDKIVKRWVLEARARGFRMRMLCERRKADALLTRGDVEVADDHLREKT